MKRIFYFIIFSLISFVLLCDFPYSLSKTEIALLQSEQLIVKTKIIKGTPWPEVTIFSIIKTTPLEAISVFTAYNEHEDFIPDLISSKIVKEIAKTDVHIAFEIKIPWPLSNSMYITGNKLSKKEGGLYQVEWYFVKSDSSKNSYGKIEFSPFKNITLLKYKSFTHPKSSLAKLFKKKMIKKTKDTIIAIKKRIEHIKNSAKMKTYLSELQNKFK